jgi:Ser/Thr protein kinase RdoA (MazF antagonist)
MPRSFAQLTPRGQAGRLRRLVLAALRHYALDVRRLRLIANHLNTIFRVDTHDGPSYTLRISHPTWRTADDMRLELSWLQALARDTAIGAPVPQPTRAGELMVTISAAGVPEARRCAMFTWLPGREMVHDLSEANGYKLGVLAAQLHAHAATFQPPPDLPRRRMDDIFARGEPDALFGPGGPGTIFTLESRAVFARMHERVQVAFADLYADPSGLRVIHNDLHQENVKLWRGRLRPLDFEDAIWGYPVQDIAMTFGDLLFFTDLDNTAYQAMRAAFQRGYTSVSPWPEAYPGQIDTFNAGRQLWRANWVARFEAPHAQRFNTWLAERLATFLDTGVLLK